jgi:membrane fusion protein (multidrug efflux system)
MSDAQIAGEARGGLLRKLRHLLLLLLGPALIAAIGGWLYLHGGRRVSTDNAYIKTNILSISANVNGMVTEVSVDESDQVQPGQLLLRVDDKPYVIALTRAEANLANVRGDIESMKAELANKRLEIATAVNDLDYRDSELDRIKQLYNSNSVSAAQFEQALYASNSAQRTLSEKTQALEVIKARLVDPDLPTDAHPRVKQALAELDKARLDLSHTEVHAPTNGVIAGVSTHTGENVMTGAPLMSLIDRSRLWIEANFKETDLTFMQVGQAVEISVDAYPGRTWQGHVAVITPATGAEFALLPAQNSSGNWVKVVQRVPVLIQLDNYQGEPLLASGMSADVSVDTGHQRSLAQLTELLP